MAEQFNDFDNKLDSIKIPDVDLNVLSIEAYREIYNSLQNRINTLAQEIKEAGDKAYQTNPDTETKRRFAALSKKYDKIAKAFKECFPYTPEIFEIIKKYTPIISELRKKITVLKQKEEKQEKISFEESLKAYNYIKTQLDEIQKAINKRNVGTLTRDYNALAGTFNNLSKPQKTKEYIKINTTRKASGWSDIELNIDQISNIVIKSFIGKGTNGTEYYEVSIPNFSSETFIMRITREAGFNNLFNLLNSEIGLIKMSNNENISLVNYIELSENSHQFQDIEIEGSKSVGTLFMDQDLNSNDIESLMEKLDNVKSWYKAPKEK